MIISFAKKTYTVPVVKAFGTPHQPTSVDAVVAVQGVLSDTSPRHTDVSTKGAEATGVLTGVEVDPPSRHAVASTSQWDLHPFCPGPLRCLSWLSKAFW